MGRVVRKGTRVAYGKVAKPILFAQSPDTVHTNLIKTGKVVQSTPGVKQLPKLWAYGSDEMLKQTVFGIEFKNPVGLAAGFDKNLQLGWLLKSVGFGFMTGGSITYEPFDGNPRPWFYRLKRSKALVVHAGLPNIGTKAVVEHLRKRTKKVFKEFPLVISVAKTNSREAATEAEAIKDYINSLKLLEKSRVPDMYELNISCPNTFGGQPFTTPARLSRLLTAIDKAGLKRPMTVKMPINLTWKEFDALLDVVLEHQVQGVTIGNLLYRENAQLRDELPDEIQGNIGGKPNRAISTDLVRRTYKKCGDKLVIIGVGGIFSAEDAYEKIKAGATMVELVTGMIYEGPQLIGEINHGLVKLLKRDGYVHISQAIGADHKSKSVK